MLSSCVDWRKCVHTEVCPGNSKSRKYDDIPFKKKHEINVRNTYARASSMDRFRAVSAQNAAGAAGISFTA